jgi:hypothetical protein
MGDSIGEAGGRPLARERAAGAQAGRQLALSVVLDGRLDDAHSRDVARLVARLGLAGVWVRRPWPGGLVTPAASTPAASTAALLARLGAEMAPCPVGLVADTDAADVGILRALTQMGASASAGQSAAAPVSNLRLALAGTPMAVARWQRWIAARSSVSAAEIGLAVAETGETAQPAHTPPAPGRAVFVPFAAGRDLDTAVTGAAASAAGCPVWVEVAVSVGRTTAEARARADTEQLFAVVGHPERDGLFGTLEECQAGAARLAHAGATELICYLPRSSDLPDVLAQLRAIAVGARVLRPGEPPSASPPPPVGWGGRRPTA